MWVEVYAIITRVNIYKKQKWRKKKKKRRSVLYTKQFLFYSIDIYLDEKEMVLDVVEKKTRLFFIACDIGKNADSATILVWFKYN